MSSAELALSGKSYKRNVSYIISIHINIQLRLVHILSREAIQKGLPTF